MKLTIFTASAMLYALTGFLISMMVGYHYRFAEPFALSTCLKYEQLFSKHNFMMRKKLRRTSSIRRSAKKPCTRKLPTAPPY
jgi:hypothetical protein